jgi:hypothetical protein
MQIPEDNPFNLGRNFQPIPIQGHALSTSVCVKALPHQSFGVTEDINYGYASLNDGDTFWEKRR